MKLLRYLTAIIVIAATGCTRLATEQPAVTAPTVKNIILLIGDGMGPQQIGLLLSYARQAPHSVLPNQHTAFDRMMDLGRLGLSLTFPDSALVVDSAASAAQLATGHSAGSEMIGTDKNGNRQVTILERAKQSGKAIGLVSDTRITHATPASFAAHQAHRSLEAEIAEDLLTTNADVMLSGGLSYWLPQTATDPNSLLHQQIKAQTGPGFIVSSSRKDDKNLLATARAQGYQLIFNKDQLQQAHSKTLGLFADALMADGIAENRNRNNPDRTQPTLQEMAMQALTILAKRPEGFVLMIEGGQIDMAGHANDTGRMLHEMLKFNDTLNAVLNWAQVHPDTLVLATADHETGGFGFSYSAANLPAPHHLNGDVFGEKAPFKPDFNFGNPEVLDRLFNQQISHEALFKQFDALPQPQQTAAQLAKLVNAISAFKITKQQAETILTREPNPFYQPGHKSLGLKQVPKMPVNSAFFPYQKDNRQNLLAQVLAEQQQVVWATGTHTSTPVLVFAYGPKTALAPFTKLLHHTEIGNLLMQHIGNTQP